MTKEEMEKRIEELELKNERLKNGRVVPNIKGSMKNQAELAFSFPYYREYFNKWGLSSTATDFTRLRKLAMSTVNKVGRDNKFTEQKVKDLSTEDFLIAVECADEIVKVIAKYKKQYLESVGREDIIKAFNMGD